MARFMALRNNNTKQKPVKNLSQKQILLQIEALELLVDRLEVTISQLLHNKDLKSKLEVAILRMLIKEIHKPVGPDVLDKSKAKHAKIAENGLSASAIDSKARALQMGVQKLHELKRSMD